MTIYNVRVSVVDLVAADAPDLAVDDLCDRLRAAGFDVYEGDAGDWFISDNQGDES